MGTSGLQATSQTGAAAHAPCRFCAAPLSVTFVDLGMSPLCQTHIEPHELNHMERFYPLHACVCGKCYLVQLEEFVSPDAIFSDYAYFSSYSDSWIEHARRYADSMIARLGLGPKSLVMEIASNDGYLLQHFVARGVPCRGIEPAANVAQVAVAKGIPTTVKFFGRKTAAEVAQEHGRPDLLLGNNVLAHVPDINDFVGGMHVLLEAGRRAHDGVPAPAQAHGREPVRHDLPRALLVPVVRYGRAHLRAPRPAAVRRRGDSDARRLAAHLRLPRRRRRAPEYARRRAPAQAWRSSAVCRTWRPTANSRRA